MSKIRCIGCILLFTILLAASAVLRGLALLGVLNPRQRREAALVHASVRLCISSDVMRMMRVPRATQFGSNYNDSRLRTAQPRAVLALSDVIHIIQAMPC